MTRTLLAVALTGLALCGTATAQGPREAKGDGVLTRADVEAHVLERFARRDANGDGYISAQEIEAHKAEMKAKFEVRRAERAASGDAPRRHREEGRRQRGEGVFAKHDVNRDGFVSREEALAAALARFDKVDADGDGKVTREEKRAQRRARRG